MSILFLKKVEKNYKNKIFGDFVKKGCTKSKVYSIIILLMITFNQKERGERKNEK